MLFLYIHINILIIIIIISCSGRCFCLVTLRCLIYCDICTLCIVLYQNNNNNNNNNNKSYRGGYAMDGGPVPVTNAGAASLPSLVSTARAVRPPPLVPALASCASPTWSVLSVPWDCSTPHPSALHVPLSSSSTPQVPLALKVCQHGFRLFITNHTPSSATTPIAITFLLTCQHTHISTPHINTYTYPIHLPDLSMVMQELSLSASLQIPKDAHTYTIQWWTMLVSCNLFMWFQYQVYTTTSSISSL